jgi:Fe-S oxidoreductase
MGWLPLASRVAARAPRLVNAATRSVLAPAIKRLAGIAPQREIPTFADGTFLRWFRRRSPAGTGERGPVMLWVDSFNNHFSPQVLQAGVAVLEDAGYRVEVPDGTQCCGLTWLTTGQLGVARRIAGRAVRSLEPAVRRGVPVVGLEPSCTAALRTDVAELLHDDGDLGPLARSVADATVTLAELLVTHTPGYIPPSVPQRSLSQTHCHQHATAGFTADSALLRAAGVDNTVLPSGCCGLAGNFGFERGHYDVSVAAGEQVLLPAVRAAADDTAVLADGFSCRTQIDQQTPRTALHVAELLAQALPRLPGAADPPNRTGSARAGRAEEPP